MFSPSSFRPGKATLLPHLNTNSFSHFSYKVHKPSQYGLWQKNRISFKMSLSGIRYIKFYDGGTADGFAFHEEPNEEHEDFLRSIKVKMAGASVIISYPSLNIDP